MSDTGRRPGRPRSEAARQAILTAAQEELLARGVGELTIEGIAARAGVGKQTIYRWWPSKADVVLEAMRAGRRPHPRPRRGVAPGRPATPS